MELNRNDRMTSEIVNAMQVVYESSTAVKGVYLDNYRMKKDGSLFDEQYLTIDVDWSLNPEESTITESMRKAEDILEEKGIIVATDFWIDEDLSKGHILIPKGGL